MRLDFQETIGRRVGPQVRGILKLNPNAAYTELVVKGPGTEPAREMIQALEARDVFVDEPRNPENAQAALAGLWLWHDWLDESHRISQKIASDTGSFWHGIMHRREGDFSNAKHWFARCEKHRALKAIAEQVESTFDRSPWVGELIANGVWRPERFVDLVEQAHRNPASDPRAGVIELQQLEWRVLFEYCAEN